MKLVTSPRACRINGTEVPAESRRVVSEVTCGEWLKMAGRLRVSSLRSWERPYYGQDLAGKTLWTWRGSGFGDALVLSAVLNDIQRRWPTARVVMSTPYPETLRPLMGAGEPDGDLAFDIIGDVLDFDAWRAFDFHRPVEEIVEWDQEPDQTDIYATHYRYFGLATCEQFTPSNRPANVVTAKARQLAADWATRTAVDQRCILYQLAASSDIRSQSEAAAYACMAAISDAFGLPVVAVGGGRSRTAATPAGVVRLIGEDPRITIGLTSTAAAVVTPDSMLNHVCAGLGPRSPPVVSLWSAFRPEDRVASYPNQHPIFAEADCAPCRAHDGGKASAEMGCPLHGGFCRSLATIAPEAVVRKLRGVL